MEQIIVSLVSLILAVVLYQERARRADAAALRREMAALRDEVRADLAVLRDEVRADLTASRKESKTDVTAARDESKSEMRLGFARIARQIDGLTRRMDDLTNSMIALAGRVGQAKGRTEVLVTAD